MASDLDCQNREPAPDALDTMPQLARLTTVAAQLGADELSVLLLVAERLVKGRKLYGSLRVVTDRRDFTREALEEAADLAVYAAAGLLRNQARKPKADRRSTCGPVQAHRGRA
jgi:hypothetical protein